MAGKLDKSKDYGIIGGTYGIARFEQDGKYFCIEGNELDGEGNPLKGGAGGAGGGKGKGGKGKGGGETGGAGAGGGVDDELAKQLGGE